MKLTSKLIGFLNRVFLRDPLPFLALQIVYDGGTMTWQVADPVLTTIPVGGAGEPLTIDLTAFTLASLATFIAGQTSYEVDYIDPDNGALNAAVLLDASGDQAVTNGSNFYAYSSLAWAYLDAVAVELQAAEAQIVAMPPEMSIPTADGPWLDYLGSIFNVGRNQGEPDGQYGPRIIATVLLPRGNNVAMELAIKAYTGQDAQVVNVFRFGTATQYYNGAFNHDGSHTYAGGTPAIEYGLFDVTYAYDLISGGLLTPFLAAVTAVIEDLRDAGTHLRGLALTGSTLADSLSRAPTDSMGPVLLSTPFYYAGSSNYDGSAAYSGRYVHAG